MESMGKKPRRRRSFTPEFKAEIVELCQRGDRSAGLAVTALSGSTVTEVNGPHLPTRRGVVTQFSGPGR